MDRPQELRPDLLDALQKTDEACTRCGACRRKCAFLERYGQPGDIAREYDPAAAGTMPFECSLCGLCGAVCPESLQPAEMFLAMRRQSVERGEAPYGKHKRILGYESRGLSPAYSFEALPASCDTVFFPGCTLPGTRPETTLKLLDMLGQTVESLGMVLHCCAKPSHDLGMQEHFEAAFMPLRDRLLSAGVKTVLTACPNCYKVFSKYGGELLVRSVYEVLAESGQTPDFNFESEVCVHDACAVRERTEMHKAARELLTGLGIEISKMKSEGRRTLCCGEGGAVALVDKDLARTWTKKRAEQAGGKKLVTYCAGCNGFLSSEADAVHLADILVDPEQALTGRAKVAGAPFTYLNRRLLIRRLRKRYANR